MRLGWLCLVPAVATLASHNATCRLFYAPSTIEGAGFGVFAGESFAEPGMPLVGAGAG